VEAQCWGNIGGGRRRKGAGLTREYKKRLPDYGSLFANTTFLAGDCRQESVDLEDVIIQGGLKASIKVEHGFGICSI
jgi:hypothetical protein